MSIWVQVTAGQGPSECCLVVARVAALLAVQCEEAGTPFKLLEQVEGDKAGTFQSVVFSLNVNQTPTWLKPWIGTIQWVSLSPYRLENRRKNWFVWVQILQPPPERSWHLADVQIDTFRASGPGGQHVNKTESAVRATHLPTGFSASAQDSRSQRENRLLALERLERKLQLEDERGHVQARKQLREHHSGQERGNPVMVFNGLDFLRKTSKYS